MSKEKPTGDKSVLLFCMKFMVDPGTGLPIELPAEKPCGVGSNIFRSSAARKQAFAEGWNAYRAELLKRNAKARGLEHPPC